jgi:acyl-coenzyme A synthetase/AMP-(fatty) acid ligase
MTLWDALAREAGRPSGALSDAARTVRLAALESGSVLGGRLESLRGRSVVLAVRDLLTASLAMIELDGVARRMVLCPAGVAPEHMPHVARTAEADVWVSDTGGESASVPVPVHVEVCADPQPGAVTRGGGGPTEWVLLTSGTTGAPKLVLHTLASLLSAFAGRPQELAPGRVWSTFYDVRRYGGLQILLRALLSGSLVLSSPGEPVPAFLDRVAALGVTHISGTPSHWRKALMSGASQRCAPAYVRLSGEIADQGILDALRAAFPRATVAHAFASTEAGVAFEIRDGKSGFPVSWVGVSEQGVEIDVSQGTLRLRSAGNAQRYLGDAPALKDEDGFVNTGDRLELREGRYHFVGRAGGIINVGGLKVHPEEVEAVINAHPAVRMSLVRARRNPITGAVVAAEVVLERPAADGDDTSSASLRQGILAACRKSLAPHKVPAVIHFVPSLEVSASGKLVRPDA